jgi:hypothetical protein
MVTATSALIFVVACVIPLHQHSKTHKPEISEPNLSALEQKSLRDSNGSEMRAELQRLSSQLRAAIVVEDQPTFPPAPADADEAHRRRTPLAALRAIADRYDYGVMDPSGRTDSEARSSEVFLLYKRYTRPDDLPLLTAGELDWSLKEAVLLLTPLRASPPVESNTSLVTGLFKSLTPEQQGEAAANTLQIGSLSEAQRASVLRMRAHLYVEPAFEHISEVSVWLRGIPSLALSIRSVGQGMAVGATGVLPRDKEAWRALSGAVSPTTGQSGPEPYRDDAGSVTFGSLTHSLSAGAAGTAGGSVGLRVEVDDSLRDKRLMVVGTSYASTERLVRAVARLYRLRVTTRRDGGGTVLRVAPPRAPSPATVADLHTALSATIPECLRRALHVEESALLDRRMREQDRRLKAGLPLAGEPDPSGKAGALRQRPEELHAAAVRLLTRAVSRREEEQSGRAARPTGEARSRGVAFSELSPLEQSAFLIAVAPDYLRMARGLAEPASPVLTDLDRCFLVGRVYERNGRRKMSLGFATVDPATGGVRQLSGISEIDASTLRPPSPPPP